MRTTYKHPGHAQNAIHIGTTGVALNAKGSTTIDTGHEDTTMDTQITLWTTVMYHGQYDRGVPAVVVNTGTAFRAKPATTFGS